MNLCVGIVACGDDERARRMPRHDEEMMGVAFRMRLHMAMVACKRLLCPYEAWGRRGGGRRGEEKTRRREEKRREDQEEREKDKERERGKERKRERERERERERKRTLIYVHACIPLQVHISLP